MEDRYDITGISVSGRYPTLIRKRTGLLSFDIALSSKGSLGLPLRNIVEISGYQGVGKSTLAYYLSGAVTQNGGISVCDLELLDRDYIPYAVGASGFKGEIKMVDTTDEKGKPIPHETMMMQMALDLRDDEIGAAVMDSVSAIQPMQEAAGDFGEAFMGRRAKLVAQMTRAVAGALRNKERPSSAFVINHAYAIIGGKGHTTAGGVVLGALAGVIMHLWTGESFYVSDDDKTSPPLGFLVRGQVEKLRFGGKGRQFQYYIVPGYGVHVGATAMFDAFAFGLAERGSRVKIGSKSIGYLKADLLAYAAEGKMRKFQPFMELCDSYAKEVEMGNVQEDTPDTTA